VELERVVPPEVLYHGTGEKYVSSIDKEGLIKKTRLFVHLSSDIDTAKRVGERHGKVVIYSVAAGEMERGGFVFYRSLNGVYLTDKVPTRFLCKL